ncbi:MAG: MerR family DNA-binding transcriptional regulator [Micromonosporaceae bacterium]|nr:MerR family DNA-binding transcriptional regulator [Micromonosporaceae bacterium]
MTATSTAAADDAPRPERTGTTSRPEPSEPERLYSIGEVLNLLRPEFADVTISKLRFLESEGLVAPLRTPAGYRKYTPAHVERLRLVLAAQRDRYLPLRVIREQLAAAERGERVVGSLLGAPGDASDGRDAGGVAPGGVAEVGEAWLTREQLRERSGLDDAGVAELIEYGLLVPGPDGRFGPEALTVARIAARLAQYGLQARHLRAYRGTADREVGLLAQLVPPLSKQGGRARALETIHELAALCAQLHGALVRQGLREMIGP